jgi:hypothetical protein
MYLKKGSLIILGGLLVSLSAFTVVIKSSGEKWRSNSPWDGSTCSACHSGGATVPTVSLSSVPAFISGNSYVSGTTYTITANVSGTYAKYGINLEILNSNSTTTAKDAGSFGAVISASTQKYTSTNLPTTISHSAASNGIYSFTWTAPDTGNVYIYCAGLGVNDDGSTSGDKVKTSSLVLMNSVSSANGVASNQVNKANLQVFPNPATDDLHITYLLTENSSISVRIFNLNGELVSDLVNEQQSVGAHSIHAQLPIGLAKGFYMIKLYVNGESTSQKLLTY